MLVCCGLLVSFFRMTEVTTSHHDIYSTSGEHTQPVVNTTDSLEGALMASELGVWQRAGEDTIKDNHHE